LSKKKVPVPPVVPPFSSSVPTLSQFHCPTTVAAPQLFLVHHWNKRYKRAVMLDKILQHTIEIKKNDFVKFHRT
jgi:hypothetical protein